MLGDITLYKAGLGFGNPGARTHQVAAQATPPLINAGEIVNKTLGNEYVITCPTSGQVVATNYVAGISTTSSTETSANDGSVDVIPVDTRQIWLVAPAVAATWNTQAKYNALVGSRVLIQKTVSGNTGSYQILAADGSTSGCVVENLNIVDYPNLVAFSFRAGLSYLA